MCITGNSDENYHQAHIYIFKKLYIKTIVVLKTIVVCLIVNIYVSMNIKWVQLIKLVDFCHQFATKLVSAINRYTI